MFSSLVDAFDLTEPSQIKHHRQNFHVTSFHRPKQSFSVSLHSQLRSYAHACVSSALHFSTSVKYDVRLMRMLWLSLSFVSRIGSGSFGFISCLSLMAFLWFSIIKVKCDLLSPIVSCLTDCLVMVIGVVFFNRNLIREHVSSIYLVSLTLLTALTSLGILATSMFPTVIASWDMVAAPIKSEHYHLF